MISAMVITIKGQWIAWAVYTIGAILASYLVFYLGRAVKRWGKRILLERRAQKEAKRLELAQLNEQQVERFKKEDEDRKFQEAERIANEIPYEWRALYFAIKETISNSLKLTLLKEFCGNTSIPKCDLPVAAANILMGEIGGSTGEVQREARTKASIALAPWIIKYVYSIGNGPNLGVGNCGIDPITKKESALGQSKSNPLDDLSKILSRSITKSKSEYLGHAIAPLGPTNYCYPTEDTETWS